MAKKTNYLDRVRSTLQKAVEEKSTKSTSGTFIPPVGKTRVRLLPPIDENDFFYHTHSYNYIPKASKEGKDIFLWTKKEYGGEKCPIDEAASQFFDSSDESIRDLGRAIKRKRKFYFNAILLDEEDPDKKLVVLEDNTNEGKLTKQFCKAMNIPLLRDVEDNWVTGEDEIDMDEDGYDLLDPEEGYDFTIIKSEEVTPIGGGRTIKKLNFESSKVAKNSRALTDEEKALMKKRVDLKTFIKYEEDVEKVREALEKYLDSNSPGNFKSSGAKEKIAKKINNQETEIKNDEVDEDEDTEMTDEEKELLNQLD